MKAEQVSEDGGCAAGLRLCSTQGVATASRQEHARQARTVLLPVDTAAAGQAIPHPGRCLAHDVGFGPRPPTNRIPDLPLTGFHPLDGARSLRDHPWPAVTCRLVACHTERLDEARLCGLDEVLASEFDRPSGLAAQPSRGPTSRHPQVVRAGVPSSADRTPRPVFACCIVHEATRASLSALRARCRRSKTSDPHGSLSRRIAESASPTVAELSLSVPRSAGVGMGTPSFARQSRLADRRPSVPFGRWPWIDGPRRPR
jgi:hypothetical protein